MNHDDEYCAEHGCKHVFIPAQPLNLWWWRYKWQMFRIKLAEWILP